jgi:hypothetical protein
VIFFPWDPAARKFAGERVFVETQVTEDTANPSI